MKIKFLTVLLLCCGLTTMVVAQCPTTSITLDSQAAIDNFATNYPGCTMITASLTINDTTLNNITSLNGLSQLTSIGDSLRIVSNHALTNMNGLNQLTSIGGNIEIRSNFGLTNLEAFSQLTFIGGFLMRGNFNLKSLEGLSQITSVGGDVIIINHCNLLNLDILSQMTSVGGDLIIMGNCKLLNLDILSQITSVGGALKIINNDDLTNVDELSQLTAVGGYLQIGSNYNLRNLDGLSQVTSVGGGLWIRDNSRLNQCCTLCPLLAADAADPSTIGGNITIQYNLFGCNSEAQINTSCPCDLVATSIPEYSPAQLNIYPNPAKNIVHFQYESSVDELVNFTIENHLGQQLIQSRARANQSVSIDISGYPAGLYLLNVLKGDKSMSRLFSVSR